MDRPAITPVILSGGAGTRLWPLSRLARPKPLVALDGGSTLLQQTALRVAADAAFAPLLVVTGAEDAEAVAAQLDEAGAARALTIVEPAPRGTAAAIALAALAAGGNALLLVMPSDHAIADEAAFRAAVEAGAPVAAEGWLVTFGIEPDRPETGYGYIRRGETIGAGAYRVERFTEKPALATAEAWLGEGGYLWNAGIFLLRADAYLAALAEHAPAVEAACRAAWAAARREGARAKPDAAAFAESPSVSADVAVMERADRVAVVPVDMGWSDLGSWEAVYEIGAKDANGNVVAGDVVVPGSRDCLVRSDGPAVVALGVSDLVIVATERAVLVVPRGETQRVKEAIDALKARRQPH
jgi:mannose-1-phosphate guanylyltransferase